MLWRICAGLIVLALVASPAPGRDGEADRPVSIYASLDGTWKGTFVGYDESGKELYRIRVEQTYETVDAHTQKVSIRDTMPDGKVITGQGRNTARKLPDGTLQLKCVVEKSNGDRVEHDGRVVQGPDGEKQIMWASKKPDRVETFREVVRREGKELVYNINGMGRYGQTLMLMNGRYRKE